MITSLAFEVDRLRQADAFGPDEFPLPPGAAVAAPKEGVDLGTISALGLAVLATAFGAAAVVETRRRRSPGSPPP